MWGEGINVIWDLWEWGDLGFEQFLWFSEFWSCDRRRGMWGEGLDALRETLE